MRARAFAAFESGNYRELYRIVESRDFDPKHHAALQDMWYRAHYREAESVRGRSLGKCVFAAARASQDSTHQLVILKVEPSCVVTHDTVRPI